MMTPNRTKRRRRESTRKEPQRLGQEALALALLALSAFFFISLYSEYLVAQGRSATNACGSFGHFIAMTHFNIFGPLAGFLLAGMFTVWAGMLLFQVRIQSWWPRLGGLALFCLAVCLLEFRFTDQSMLGSAYEYKGGLLGMYIGQATFDFFGLTGTTIFAFLAVALGLMFTTGMPVANFLRVGLAMIGTAASGVSRKTPGVARRVAGSVSQAASDTIAKVARSSSKADAAEVSDEEKNLLLGDEEEEEYEYEDEEEEEGLEEYDEDEEEEDEEYEEEDEEDEEEDEEEEEDEDLDEYAEDEEDAVAPSRPSSDRQGSTSVHRGYESSESM